MGYFKQLAGKLLAFNDGTEAAPGQDRASFGDLAAYTGPNGVLSPAQAGFRAVDDQGNAIFDSLGLIAVMKSLGRTHVSPVTTSGAAYADVPGTSIPFSLKRQSSVLVITSFYGKTSGAVGEYAFLQLRCGTHTQVADWGDAPCNFDKLNTGFCNGSTFFNVTLPAGSYDAALQVGSDAGQSCLIQVAFVEVFLLGS